MSITAGGCRRIDRLLLLAAGALSLHFGCAARTLSLRAVAPLLVPSRGKPRQQLLATSRFHNATEYLQVVTRRRAVWNISYCTNCPSFWVICSIYQQTDPRLYYGTSAHRARFQRHVERTIIEVPVLQNLSGCSQSQDFRVGCGVAVSFPTILGDRDFSAGAIDNYSAYRYFPSLPSSGCEFYGLAHPPSVHKISRVTHR
jgi:hypothetical protein